MSVDKENHILIAADHAGFELKQKLQELLTDIHWKDLGPSSSDRVDYPDYAAKVAQGISSGQAKKGILICGSGVGMSMAANKFKGIRAAHVENPVSARLSREHNDANVLCLGSRFLAPEYAAEIVKVWLETPFSKGERHIQRIEKIKNLES